MNQVPLAHLSFSALKAYLSNPAGFYRQYVLMERTDELSPAALVGRTIHKQMEGFYKQLSWEQALEITAAFFNENVKLVADWGKTGSPEKAWGEAEAGIRDLKRAITKKRLPAQDATILFVETPLTELCGPSIPLKVVPDLAVSKKAGINIYDWKSCSVFTDSVTAVYWLQAYFNIKAIEKRTGQFVRSMTFVEVKKKLTKSTDLSDTVRLVTIPNNPSAIEFRAVRRLIDFMLQDINGEQRHYLGNIMDLYSGDDEWTRWIKETEKDQAYAL